MNDYVKDKTVEKKTSGLSPSQAQKMSNLTLGVSYSCKLDEAARLQELIDRLEEDCSVIFSELLLRKNDDFESVIDFIKECEKFAS